MTIRVNDTVLILNTAPKCSAHRGKTGKIERIRHTNGIGNTVFFVRFPDSRCELHKEKNLKKIEE